MKRGMFKVVVVLFAGLLLASCGDSSLGGGVGEFKTVTVSATADTISLESDVLTGNTCTAGASTGGTFVTDTVIVNLASTVFPGVTNPLTVEIDNITITYAPATNNSPRIPSKDISTIGQRIVPGGTLALTVPVAPDTLKLQLVNNFNLQLCSTTVYEYFATISFTVKEIGTGTTSVVTTSMNVAFADRSGA